MAHPTLIGALCAALFCSAVQAQTRPMHIPAGELKTALDQYAAQTGVQLLYRADDVRGRHSPGVQGPMEPAQALSALLAGTGMSTRKDGSNALLIFRPTAVEAQAAAADTELTTVTVTAQKRTQSAQAVPIAMTALSAKTLDVHRVQGLQDLARHTPGLLVSAFSQANPTIAIRGISNTFSQIGVNKPVGIVVDDVFIPRNSAASFELFDLESIAVLKGPQGTLFGRNVTGGAIVITTRQPDLSQFAAESEVSAGNHGERQAKGLVNVPLGANAALKLSTSLRQRDGLGRDRLSGREQDDIDSQNFRAQALFRAGPGFDATISADYGDDRNGGRTLSSDTLGNDGDVRTSEVGAEQRFARIIAGLSAKLVWRLPAGEITSVSAWRKSQSGEDYSGVGASYTFLTTGSQSLTPRRRPTRHGLARAALCQPEMGRRRCRRRCLLCRRKGRPPARHARPGRRHRTARQQQPGRAVGRQPQRGRVRRWRAAPAGRCRSDAGRAVYPRPQARQPGAHRQSARSQQLRSGRPVQ